MMTDEKLTITGTVSPREQWYGEGIGKKSGKPYQGFKFTMVVTKSDGTTENVECVAWYELAKQFKNYLKVGTPVTATGIYKPNTFRWGPPEQLHCSDIQGTLCTPQLDTQRTGQMNLGDTPSLPMIKPGSADPDEEDTYL